MKLAWFGGIALLSGLLAAPSFVQADVPPVPQPEQVQKLLQQLDDEQFTARQEADHQLRQLGIGVVPHLRQALADRPPLEVYQRLEAIIGHLMHIKWYANDKEAKAEAARTGKPLLVIAALGKTDGSGSLATRAMLARTLANWQLVGYLQQNYVLVWHDLLPEVWYDDVAQAMLGPVAFAAKEVEQYAAGRGGSNLRSYFCTPEGKVIRYLEGFWGSETYQSEARFARQLAEQERDLGSAWVRTVLALRSEEIVRRRPGTDPAEARRLDLLSKNLIESARLLDQPLPTILGKQCEEVLGVAVG